MTTDLAVLVAIAIYCHLLPYAYAAPRLVRGGLAWGVGNREVDPPTPAWVARAERAHRNLLENLPSFAALVLVAHVTGRHDALTALGATVFLWARLAHSVAYIAGLIWVRSIAFYTGLAGEALIAWRILAG